MSLNRAEESSVSCDGDLMMMCCKAPSCGCKESWNREK